MNTWLALLRGINLLGRNKVSMAELAAAFEQAGFDAVRTYIRSGNVVFRSARGNARTLGPQITDMVRERFGIVPHVMVLSRDQLARAVRANPFPGARRDHKSLHLFFLSGTPRRKGMDSLAGIEAGREAFALKGGVFYLYTPDGFAESVLRSRFERCLAVAATGRNWRTVTALLQLLREAS
jgi:uncharacterized protein (DUF1697 family)